ncbi:MAG: hypothetical protein AAB676_08915 [Verrucomicrobiota bacterium]
MTKLKITLIIATVALSVTVTLVIHRNAQVKLLENDAALRQQDKQLTELIAEQERLSNRVAEAKNSTNSQLNELAKLRDRAQMLQKQTNELGFQLKSNRLARASQPASKTEPHPPEYYNQLHRTAAAKPGDARNLSAVFAMYASDHQGRFPSSFDQVAEYLRKEKMPLSGTNQFDIVYRGSLDDLKGIPRGAVAVIRDRQSWVAPSGKWARVYGLANGSSLIVESDDNFRAWEAEHIISSAPARQ